MRYKLNPENIDLNQIQMVRNDLAKTLKLNKWLPETPPEIKDKILDIMAETAVESASMLVIPPAEFRIVQERGWTQSSRVAEALPIVQQRRKNSRDRVRVGEWFMVDVAGKLQGPLWEKVIEADLRDMVAHEHYHLKESRTTPKRYKRALRKRIRYDKSFSELAASLFAEAYLCQRNQRVV